MQADTYIPRRLDDQWKVGLWDFDVAFPVLLSVFVGYLASSKLGFFLAVCAGVAVSRWLSRKKADKHPAFVLHWAYWYLPVSPLTSMRSTPPSHIRKMVG
jgi:conjugal transfer pilus assembly protein TraL